MQCLNCSNFPPILECTGCDKKLCFPCDETIHKDTDIQNHQRINISFKDIKKSGNSQVIQDQLDQRLKKLQLIADTHQKQNIDSQKQSQQQPQQSGTQSNVQTSQQTNSDSSQPSKIQDQFMQILGPQLQQLADLRRQLLAGKNTQAQLIEQKPIVHPDQEKLKLEYETLVAQLQVEDEEFQSLEKKFLGQLMGDDLNKELHKMLEEYIARFEKGEEQIDMRIKAVEKLKEVYNLQLQQSKAELDIIRGKYEQQILDMEERLIEASARIDKVVESDMNEDDDQEELNGDENQGEVNEDHFLEGDEERQLNADLKKLEEDVQNTILYSNLRADELSIQAQKYEELTAKVKQASNLQERQISKMDEIIKVFHLCSDEMEKEKQLLMFDNQKILIQVEQLSKFFTNNSDLLNRVAQLPQQI